MNRIKMKRRVKIKKKNIIALIIISFFITTIYFLNLINKKIIPIIINIAEPEVNNISTLIINKAVNSVIENGINLEELFTTITSSDGKIQTIDFNSMIVNQLLNKTTTTIQNNLKQLEEGNLENIGIEKKEISQNKIEKLKQGIIMEIPIGTIFRNSLLSNIGPKIPIKIHYIGNVNSNITTNIKQYGINNALLEIGIKLDVTAQIILPLTTQKTTLNCYIPIAIKVIQGIVPNYYSNGIENQSPIYSIPF